MATRKRKTAKRRRSVKAAVPESGAVAVTAPTLDTLDGDESSGTTPDFARASALLADAPAPDGDAPPKRGRGRPSNAELTAERDRLRAELAAKEQAAQSLDTARHTVEQMAMILGEVAASNGAPAWRIQPEQAAQIGTLWAPVLAPWFARLGGAAPAASAVLGTAAVLAPNWREHRALAAKPSDTEPEGAANATSEH